MTDHRNAKKGTFFVDERESRESQKRFKKYIPVFGKRVVHHFKFNLVNG